MEKPVRRVASAKTAEYRRGMIHDSQNRIALERSSEHIVTAFILTGLVFMLLPGTF